MPLFPINYLEKTYNTTIHKDLTDEEYKSIVDGIKCKPSINEVCNQLLSIRNGGTRLDKVYSYFFKETAYKTKLIYNNWSIDEALKHKPLMEFFAGKVDENKNVFPDSIPLYEKIETAFRLCGFKTCSKPSNFPMEVIDSVLKKYGRLGGNYLDYSCGWGVRLLSSMKNFVHYFGIDPNDELVGNLIELAELYRQVNLIPIKTDIRCTGSEVFIPEWEGVMDLEFTSPPYYSLEDYRIGEKQSYKAGVSYDEWIANYVRPTIANCKKYLKPDGVFGYNIKNNFKYIPYDLEGDWMSIALENGFVLIDTMPLVNITRVSGHRHKDAENTMETHDNNELIRFFRIEETKQ